MGFWSAGWLVERGEAIGDEGQHTSPEILWLVFYVGGKVGEELFAEFVDAGGVSAWAAGISATLLLVQNADEVIMSELLQNWD